MRFLNFWWPHLGFFNVRSQKSSLVSGNRPGEIFLSLTRPHSRMCIRIYIFNLKKQKIKNQKKQKKLMKKREYLRRID